MINLNTKTGSQALALAAADNDTMKDRHPSHGGFLARLPTDWATPPSSSSAPDASSRTPCTRTSTSTAPTTTPARSHDDPGLHAQLTYIHMLLFILALPPSA